MNKLVGVGLLVAALVVGGMVVALADPAQNSANVSVNFSIPSYIAIWADNSSVTLDNNGISGPGTYTATNTLHVLSTTEWTVSHQVSWDTAQGANYPNGFNPDAHGNLFTANSDITSGTWGLNSLAVTYTLNLTGNNLQYFPAGDYTVVVVHTATTTE